MAATSTNDLKLTDARPHAFYHWWGYPEAPPAYANLLSPVLLSIATLRAVSEMPVVVFDVSGYKNDWAHFPERLNFSVVETTCRLKRYEHLVGGWRYLSRIHDLAHGAGKYAPDCGTVMYVDSDVFWLRNPLPLEQSPEKFVFNGYNSGFFYYDRRSGSNELFYDIYDSYTRAAVYSQDVRGIMKRFVGYDSWAGVWDEMILTYMVRRHRDLFNITSLNEHATARRLREADRETVKLFHGNGIMVANHLAAWEGERTNSRGLLCLLAKELYANLSSVLEPRELRLIFGEPQLEFCLPRQFSLFDDIDKLLATESEEDQHFHVERMLG